MMVLAQGQDRKLTAPSLRPVRAHHIECDYSAWMTLGWLLTPRRPRGAGGGEEQAGEARCPSPPQTLFAGEVGREGHSITGLAAAGSSRHWQKIAAIPASAGILPRSWH